MTDVDKSVSRIVERLEHHDSARIVEQVVAQRSRLSDRMESIATKVAVLSGKGGVGKSTVTVHLALALARANKKVGILDVDLNGPCIAHMLGIENARFDFGEDGAVPPQGPLGIKVASLAFLADKSAPRNFQGPTGLSPVWLGTMEMTTIRELLADVVWGDLDYLLADLPPGAAADKPPLIAGLVPDLGGAVVVTTPSRVATEVVKKSLLYCRALGIRGLGLVSNMSGFACTRCGAEEADPRDEVELLSTEASVPILGSVPYSQRLARSLDEGAPLSDPESPIVQRFDEIARRLDALVNLRDTIARHL